MNRKRVSNPPELDSVDEPPDDLTMDFPEAIRQVTQGKRITRVAWANQDIYLLRSGGYLCIRKLGVQASKITEEFQAVLVSDGDLLADDWIVVDGKAAVN